MRNKGQILLGAVIVVAGLAILLETVFHIDLGMVCWPSVLILLGVWIIARPYLISRNTALGLSLFGPVHRKGPWQVTDQEIWLFVGDVRLDLTQAEIPPRESVIRVFSFVSDVRMVVPEGVGVSISSTAFVTDARLLGQRREGFLETRLVSEGYEAAERRVRLETICFVADLKVARG